MFTVYALYNKDHKKIYIGQTKELKDRLYLHNNRVLKNSYTSKFGGGWKIIYTENVSDRKQALVREKQLKSYRGRSFIKSFIPA